MKREADERASDGAGRLRGFWTVATGLIDDLIVQQRRLIELLDEKRQAVTSHAVTKGLNPEAPMKPAGVESVGGHRRREGHLAKRFGD